MIDYLNNNSGALMVVFTGIVTLSTAIYAWLTALLVRETIRMRKSQTEPELEIVAKSREEIVGLVFLRIRNVGLGPAHNIRFDFRNFSQGATSHLIVKDFQESEFLKTGLRYLGPGEEWTSNFTDLRQKFDRKIESFFEIKVEYTDSFNSELTKVFSIDFKEFKGWGTLGKPNIYSIAKSLEGIQKDIANFASGFNKLRVYTYSKEDRALERDQILADRREFKAEQIEKEKDSLDSGSGSNR